MWPVELLTCVGPEVYAQTYRFMGTILSFYQCENCESSHILHIKPLTFNTTGLKGTRLRSSVLLCAVLWLRCYLVLRSVWVVTTCWGLPSRRTPACSVGAADSPATASKTASPPTTCPTVTEESTRRPASESVSSVFVTLFIFLFFFYRLQPDVHHPCRSHDHLHQGDGGHPQLPGWVSTHPPNHLHHPPDPRVTVNSRLTHSCQEPAGRILPQRPLAD